MGLSAVELETLAEKKEPCVKTSRRDFPFVLAKVLGLIVVEFSFLICHCNPLLKKICIYIFKLLKGGEL